MATKTKPSKGKPVKSVKKSPKMKPGAGSSLFKDAFIKDFTVLQKTVEAHQKAGKKVVLTQGVYDLIHEGHAAYLEKARAYGDLLVVGVDSDALTRLRKGPNRPIVPEGERLKMLAHLRHVDIVTVRDVEHGIGDLIKLLKPDVLVTSSSTKDFSKKEQLEYKKWCGKVIVLPPQAVTSTSARIRNLRCRTVSG
jgi:D-beta-D-heptose 7-phosphate kinase/D-beta-D-heptose 1-phosphate adenosyltransferase